MVGAIKGTVVVGEGRQGHEKHSHDALHWGGHGVRYRVVYALGCVRVVERQKDNIISWKTNINISEL